MIIKFLESKILIYEGLIITVTAWSVCGNWLASMCINVQAEMENPSGDRWCGTVARLNN